jgi:hypothetical protein
MVVAGGDYVHFVVEYDGKIEKCRVTETALLNRERMSRKDAGHAQLIAIFVRHRAEIEHLALAKLQREGHSDRGVVVTTEDLNLDAGWLFDALACASDDVACPYRKYNPAGG